MNQHLFIIGGNENKNQYPDLLQKFVQLCGESPEITIITGASAIPYEISDIYSDLFIKLGAKKVNSIPFTYRKDGNNEKYINSLNSSDGVFITGGNQVKLASRLLGTLFHEKMIQFYNSGKIYGGTSAGASIVSTLMVAGGRGAYNPRKNIIKLSGGLGLIDSIIVDQHFRERNRLFRLATAISINPNKIGIGIDENTALHIINGESATVYGSNSVTIIDGRNIEYTGHEEGAGKDPIALTNIKFHNLPEGWKYNLISFKPLKIENFESDLIQTEENDLKCHS
jgi:cyanophycinase